MEYEGCASEVINHSAVEETAMLGGILVQEEDPLFAVVSRLAAGETFARENLCQRWYRGITKLKWAEELQRSGILLVQKNAAGGSNPEGNKEQKKDENDDADGENVEQGEEEYINADECVARLRREFNFQRVLNVVIYGEDDERAEILKEEHDNISQIVMMMEECMDRQSLIEEAQSRAALVLEVMKPRITSRYSYAWGVKTYSTFKPVKAEMDRLRPADRHKPAYMRSKQPTCRVPFEHAHYLPNGEQKMVRVSELNFEKGN
ncbi:uncharacterized protein TEOVI_000841400 [Trypanosoma equiperdum]|uniref:Uncharacterized protein n=4 Tax=Trypanozoon TaxID=39700 RepID=Q57WK2_TRYB2|nr:hypothetical protein, conserved [Trypanosoma brucei gambiense DAL972]XP_847651.1 hypothetical protein, conserved [Trypanosoma brucei brucei TREU927]AAX70017.1 hypothetical protein, conserved [Trypanosoma brucei]RHW71017.1 hypothetical protein DPX39_080057800 [Trypanosoma brucei equiperdum]SCU66867.1 hypothetical protein, conserved [Trypanosoma equiperdum]AAZ13585.1 hypothetical protein, conserved [Trypanosoma brucei brucei TREU927]CBH13918.1 hypothetical protein, conserved [Trypanosoma bru|eukprot:XP_011776194.1 hypothetical protein, conserved [Trypanosoma brucei gambiense DAL972]